MPAADSTESGGRHRRQQAKTGAVGVRYTVALTPGQRRAQADRRTRRFVDSPVLVPQPRQPAETGTEQRLRHRSQPTRRRHEPRDGGSPVDPHWTVDEIAPAVGSSGQHEAPREEVATSVDTRRGLAKFDIGMVPAPVTPPATARHAAWFLVASAGFVLVGMLTLMTLAGPRPSPFRRLAPPARPTGLFLAPPTISDLDDRGRGGLAEARPTAPGPTGGRPTPTSTRLADDVVLANPLPTDGAALPSRRPGTSDGGRREPVDGHPWPPPATVADGGPLVPLTTSREITARTTRFFSLAATSPRLAFDELGSPALKRSGFARFATDFAGVRGITVSRVEVHTASRTAVATIVATHTDGRRTVERRELVFTAGSDPLVDAERLISAGRRSSVDRALG